MIVKCFGSNRFIDQRPRIEKGFSEHKDWRLADYEEPYTDLLYSSDPGGYDEALKYREDYGGILFMQVLDVPWHLIQDIDTDLLKSKLLKADAVLANSESVKRDIKTVFDLDSHVVNHPAKEVYPIPGMYKDTGYLKFMHVGRRNDPNKRYSIISDLMTKYYNPNHLINVGSDKGIGKIAGEVSDDYLPIYYNCTDYILIGTKNGGIELPGVEALMCGKKLVVPNDSDRSEEHTSELQ